MTQNLQALVVFADPSLHRSRISRRVAEAAASLPGVQVQDLYQLYPDLYIDVRRERALLLEAPLVVFVFQMAWYAMPALMKEWCDTVLKPEWAGAQGRLSGKTVFAAVACNSRHDDYRAGGMHGRPLADFLVPLAQTARACGMAWLEPHVFYGADHPDQGAADGHAAQLRRLLAIHTGLDQTPSGDLHGT